MGVAMNVETYRCAPAHACPFCGQEARIREYQDGEKLYCPDCEYSSPEGGEYIAGIVTRIRIHITSDG